MWVANNIVVIFIRVYLKKDSPIYSGFNGERSFIKIQLDRDRFSFFFFQIQDFIT